MASAKIDTASSGDTTLVTAPGSGKKIYVYGFYFVVAGTTTVLFKNGSTALQGAMSFDRTVCPGIVVARGRDPIFVCADNAALKITLGSNIQVSGAVVYEVR